MVTAVDTTVEVVRDVEVTEMVVILVVVEVEGNVDVVGEVVVFDAEHDANTMDVTVRQVKIIQITPRFIWASFFILKTSGKLTKNSIPSFIYNIDTVR